LLVLQCIRIAKIERGQPTVRRLQLILGVLVSAAALALVLHDVHWHEVGDALGEANYAYILGSVCIFAVTIWLRALRWRQLFPLSADLKVRSLYGCLTVAYLINNVLPFQMGDFGRAYLLSELERLSAVRCLSTVVVERTVDVLVLLLLLLCLAPFVAIPDWARAPSLTIAALFLSVAIVLLLAARRRGRFPAFLERILAFAPQASRAKLREMLESGLDGLSVLTEPRIAARLVSLSVMAWLAAGLVMYSGMLAFDLGLGYDAALFLLVATSFGFLVPATPGSFGVYHAIVIATLTEVFGVDKNAAVSFALVAHMVVYLPPVLAGLAFLWVERGVWKRATLFDKLAELRATNVDSAASTGTPRP
jgi:uncharacterized protein (TIRG00374 family)